MKIKRKFREKIITFLTKLNNHTLFSNHAGYFNKLMHETSTQYITSIMTENTAVFLNRANLHNYLLQNFLNKQS